MKESPPPNPDLFRLLVDAVKDYALYMLDPEGRVASWNVGAERIKGYTASEVMGKPFEMFFTEEDVRHGKPSELLRRAREDGRATDEGIRVRKNGQHFLSEGLLTRMQDEDGRLRGFAKITRDITDKKALEELKASQRHWQETERQFRALTDSAPVLIWMSGKDMLCTYLNQPWLDFTGRGLEQALGEGWTQSVHKQDIKGALDVYHENFRQRKAYRQEYRLRRRDGAYRWMLVSGAPRFTADGAFLGYVGSAIDIHERKELMEKVVESRNQLDVILQGVDNPITAQTPEGRMVFANETAARYLGFPSAADLLKAEPGELASRYEILGEEGRPFSVDQLPTRKALRGEESEQVVLRYKVKGEDREKWAIVKAKPVLGSENQVLMAVTFFQDITEIKRREIEERKSKEQLRIILGGIKDAIIAQEADGKLLFINEAAARLFGFASAEAAYAVQGTPEASDLRRKVVVSDEYGKAIDPDKTPARLALKGEEAPPMTLRFKMEEGGQEHWVVTRATPVFDEKGNVLFAIQIIHDITEVRETEERFRQAQKMEAVGRLAGGIAHDFNNLLTVINGYSDLLLSQLEKVEDAEPRANVMEVREAGRRAASLTQQLLAFSRKQILAPKVLDLNDIVRTMEAMLKRVIGEDVSLVTRLADGLPAVRVDVPQMEQAIMNLAVNARDAMPQGGQLTMETDRASPESLPEEPAAGHRATYVRLAVRDTGSGMTESVRTRIFEPFFTTKEAGKGTGLGLAMVYGIVKQSGGSIKVTSEPGEGSTFEIFLPAVPPETGPERPPSAPVAAAARRGDTVLVVEDEDAVRKLIHRILDEGGYSCLLAETGEQAVEIMRARGGSVDLLLTDVVLGGVDGVALAEKLRAVNPGLRVLYMSGYTDSDIVQRGSLEEMDLIHKPFTAKVLLERIGSLLKV